MTIFFLSKPDQEKRKKSSASHKSSKSASSSRPTSSSDSSQPLTPSSSKSSKHSSRRTSRSSRHSRSTDPTTISDSGSLDNEKLFLSTFGPSPADLHILTQDTIMSSPTKKDFKDSYAEKGHSLPLPGLSGSANGPIGNLLKGAVGANGELKDAALMVGIKLDIEAEVHLTARVRGDILVGLY